jgi:hypothetical protein
MLCLTNHTDTNSAVVLVLQVARLDNQIVTATSNSSGSLSVLLMQLPADLPGATTADLQVRGGGLGLGGTQNMGQLAAALPGAK